jgi:hypothetical protein
MYQMLTVIGGLAIMALSLVALIRNLATGGMLGNPLRFLASGALLVAHYPLVQWIEGLVQNELNRAHRIDPGMISAHWSAVIMVVCAQFILLPTAKEIYTGFLYRRLGMMPGSRE